MLEITHIPAAAAARAFLAQGFCPVECSFGQESIVDVLQMDHHGLLSQLEGVAIRAYRDHFGARREDPRFVVTGAADTDATFAIAALAGLLPHPSRAGEFASAPSHLKQAWTRDLTSFAELVNRADLNPIGLRLEETDDGLKLLLFKILASGVQDAASFYAGVDRWRLLLGPTPPTQLLAAVKAEESARVSEARAAHIEIISDHVAFVESKVWGYDIWYAEVRPVIIAYQPGEARASIGCPDLATARTLFGSRGLLEVFPRLQPSGWGGRETIGGSPRDVRLMREQASDAARATASMIAAPSLPPAKPQ